MSTFWVVLVLTNIFVWKFPDNEKPYKHHIRQERNLSVFESKEDAIRHALSVQNNDDPFSLMIRKVHDRESEILSVEIFETKRIKSIQVEVIPQKLKLKEN